MPKTIGQLLAEADEMIEKSASATKTAEAHEAPAESVDELASRLVKLGKELSTVEEADTGLLSKIAHAVAVVDTMLNLPTLAKVAALEDKARAAGHTNEQIDAFLEKNASAFPMVSCLQFMSWG